MAQSEFEEYKGLVKGGKVLRPSNEKIQATRMLASIAMAEKMKQIVAAQDRPMTEDEMFALGVLEAGGPANVDIAHVHNREMTHHWLELRKKTKPPEANVVMLKGFPVATSHIAKLAKVMGVSPQAPLELRLILPEMWSFVDLSQGQSYIGGLTYGEPALDTLKPTDEINPNTEA